MKTQSTFVFALLIILTHCALLRAQLSQPAGDMYAPYIVNPDPVGVAADTMAEIFGSGDNMLGPGSMMGRGNIFYCDSSRRIIEHRLYLNLHAVGNIWFLIYEGDTFLNGEFNLKHSVERINQGPGQGWYSSGPLEVILLPGKYYMIYAQWDVNANWFLHTNITTYPVPCSFGSLYSGLGWACGPDYMVPPAPSRTNCEVENERVAYFQAIVTDDVVPVELSSFTCQLNNSDITLNWVTATENNNLGFEVQKLYGSEFNSIGFIPGHGTTTISQQYFYKDKNLNPGSYSYRLKQVDFDGSFAYSDVVNIEITAPQIFSLEQNYPNPFNPLTTINFSLPSGGMVNLKVFNVLGVEEAEILSQDLPAGNHSIQFDASRLSSGIYYYRLETGGFTSVKKMILMK